MAHVPLCPCEQGDGSIATWLLLGAAILIVIRLMERSCMTQDKLEESASQSVFEDTSKSTDADTESRCLACRVWWKVAIVLVLVAAVAAIVVNKGGKEGGAGSSEVTTEGSGQPAQTAEPTEKGRKEKPFPPDTVLATVNDEDITLAELESALEEIPPKRRSSLKNNLHGFLDELISRKLLLRRAREASSGKTEGEGTEKNAAGRDELINTFLQRQVLEGVEVTEEDVRAFYEEHKDQMPAGRSFEELKGSLRDYALQEKQREAVDAYLEKLREEAAITRNEEWIEAQKKQAADNPLDRALKKDMPVLADFGRGKCVPCKMMKPILDDLKEEYAGRAEILIIEIDEYPAVTQRVNIRAIPTQIFYNSEGKEVDRHQGFMSREAIVEQLKEMGVQ